MCLLMSCFCPTALLSLHGGQSNKRTDGWKELQPFLEI